ncbi:hypothetical protein PR048_032373 [Dryococelus australis]|uniref:Uncharacterized protein n=1 Tax=Dryococelus australis TaxID=614101 RepID=A0ABQ9G223_9NEOP|nr:hypothetical protein PR048_032373 [Dryococelus australis]
MVVPRSPRSQSENGYSRIKGNATQFRLCQLYEHFTTACPNQVQFQTEGRGFTCTQQPIEKRRRLQTCMNSTPRHSRRFRLHRSLHGADTSNSDHLFLTIVEFRFAPHLSRVERHMTSAALKHFFTISAANENAYCSHLYARQWRVSSPKDDANFARLYILVIIYAQLPMHLVLCAPRCGRTNIFPDPRSNDPGSDPGSSFILVPITELEWCNSSLCRSSIRSRIEFRTTTARPGMSRHQSGNTSFAITSFCLTVHVRSTNVNDIFLSNGAKHSPHWSRNVHEFVSASLESPVQRDAPECEEPRVSVRHVTGGKPPPSYLQTSGFDPPPSHRGFYTPSNSPKINPPLRNSRAQSWASDSAYGSAGMEWRGEREIPEETRRPTASSGTIPTCENPVTRPGIEPGSPWWEASAKVDVYYQRDVQIQAKSQDSRMIWRSRAQNTLNGTKLAPGTSTSAGRPTCDVTQPPFWIQVNLTLSRNGIFGASAEKFCSSIDDFVGLTAEEVDGTAPSVDDSAVLMAVDAGSDVGVTSEEFDGTIPI